MNDEPGAASLFFAGLSRIADAAGVVLLIALGWRVFFVYEESMQTRALALGLLSLVACWTDRTARKNVPVPMLVFVVIAFVSAAVNRWTIATDWWSLVSPASYLLVMVVFVYGAAHLLRTPERLSMFVVLLIVATSVLAARIVFDRSLVAGAFYERGGTAAMPSVPHWGGIQGTSLLLTLAMAFALAPPAVNRSLGRIVAGVLLAGGFLAAAYLNASKGGLLAMAATVLFAGIFVIDTRARPLWRYATAAALVIGSIAGAVLLSRQEISADLRELSGRTLIWEASWRLAMEHPWLGVGPGNYSPALAEGGYAQAYFTRYGGGVYNAHSLLLHVGTETGVLGLLALLTFLGWTVRACWRAWMSRCVPLVSVGLLFALVGFFLHSFSEHFLDARPEVERTRVLMWMLFGAVLALDRLQRVAPSGPS